MSLKRPLLAIILAAALAAGWPAAAHHSFAMYEPTKTLTFKGTVKIVPVDQSALSSFGCWCSRTAAAIRRNGAFETTSPGVLTRGGWTRNSSRRAIG